MKPVFHSLAKFRSAKMLKRSQAGRGLFFRAGGWPVQISDKYGSKILPQCAFALRRLKFP